MRRSLRPVLAPLLGLGLGVGVGLGLLALSCAAPARSTAAPDSVANGTKLAPSTEPVVVLETSMGRIAWRFFPDAAPGHVAYVTRLVDSGFYDGTTFHRVIPHFVVQGGDPNSKNADRADDGEGEGDQRLKGEFSTTLHYRPGTVGMARDTDPDSGSCQFFIALENLPRLDGKYTIFGEVVEGLDVARRIAEVPRDLKDNPLERVTVTAHMGLHVVPVRPLSAEPGVSGEVLTGPGKPVSYDPDKDATWQPPAVLSARGTGPFPGAVPRLEVVIDSEGTVLDVRFPALDTPDAARLRAAVMQWRFKPARRGGKTEHDAVLPVTTRFAIDADGKHIGPPEDVLHPAQ